RGGDEWFNWISHENYLIIKGNDGYWYYSNIERGILVPNQARVGIELPPFRSASINDLRKVKKSYERLFKGGCPLYEERMK
ncbi:hypothetical protein NLC26_01875, partial [Candidatus Aminicenantes bacterium AC-708-M15]|nr:hypothetical protein [Candidatus Aminicenantes bacterium AC-708-M15]